jgi:hypothetical protein
MPDYIREVSKMPDRAHQAVLPKCRTMFKRYYQDAGPRSEGTARMPDHNRQVLSRCRTTLARCCQDAATRSRGTRGAAKMPQRVREVHCQDAGPHSRGTTKMPDHARDVLPGCRNAFERYYHDVGPLLGGTMKMPDHVRDVLPSAGPRSRSNAKMPHHAREVLSRCRTTPERYNQDAGPQSPPSSGRPHSFRVPHAPPPPWQHRRKHTSTTEGRHTSTTENKRSTAQHQNKDTQERKHTQAQHKNKDTQQRKHTRKHTSTAENDGQKAQHKTRIHKCGTPRSGDRPSPYGNPTGGRISPL